MSYKNNGLRVLSVYTPRNTLYRQTVMSCISSCSKRKRKPMIKYIIWSIETTKVLLKNKKQKKQLLHFTIRNYHCDFPDFLLFLEFLWPEMDWSVSLGLRRLNLTGDQGGLWSSSPVPHRLGFPSSSLRRGPLCPEGQREALRVAGGQTQRPRSVLTPSPNLFHVSSRQYVLIA